MTETFSSSCTVFKRQSKTAVRYALFSLQDSQGMCLNKAQICNRGQRWNLGTDSKGPWENILIMVEYPRVYICQNPTKYTLRMSFIVSQFCTNQGNRKLLFNDHWVSVGEDEKVHLFSWWWYMVLHVNF